MSGRKRNSENESALQRRLAAETVLQLLDGPRELSELDISVLAALVCDAVLGRDVDTLALIAERLDTGRGLWSARESPAQMGSLAILRIVGGFRDRLSSGSTHSFITHGSNAHRLLLDLRAYPRSSNRESAQRLMLDETEVSRVGRRLRETGLAMRRRFGTTNSWEISPRGMELLELLAAQAAHGEVATPVEDPAAQHVTATEALSDIDVGVDIGTRAIRVARADVDIVLTEPSLVLVEAKSRRPIAFGLDAWEMMYSSGRTPPSDSLVPVWLLRDGVVGDVALTVQMIKHLVDKARGSAGTPPRRMLLGMPSVVPDVDRRAVRDEVGRSGARWISLFEESMASAIGAGLPVWGPSGSLIANIGGNSTEVAVLALGGIVVSRSIRVGGDNMDQDVVNYARREFNLLLGERTAEDIKIAVGSAYPGKWDAQRVTLRGRDLLTGLPRSVEVGPDNIRQAIEVSVSHIVDTIKDTIKETPPELVADIMDQGIVLAGGGALLAGLDKRVAEATQMPVHVADDPLACAARGIASALRSITVFDRTLDDPPSSHRLSRNVGEGWPNPDGRPV